MGKIRFEYYSHDLNSVEGSVNLYRRMDTGGEEYYPVAEYEALEAKLDTLVEAGRAVYESGEFYGNTFECEGDAIVKLNATIEAVAD